MRVSTIRPGLLVSLSTRVVGNVEYYKRDLQIAHVTEAGKVKASWETEKTINDPAEFEAATKVRGKARSLITSLCAASSFGLLCPQDQGDKLAAAITEAQALADTFNATASLTRVQVYVIAGRIAADDVEAMRAINSEVTDLLNRMESGVRNLDVDAIREAATKAKALGSMITPAASERLEKAIATARSAARQIVKAGETAAKELDTRAIRAITESRTAFLDLDDAAAIQAPTVTGRALDLEEAPSELRPDPTNPRIDLDMDEPERMAAAPAAAMPQLELI